MTNHEMMSAALKSYRGKTLATSEIRKIILGAYPEFNTGSMLPNDHALGNKSPCGCAGTKSRIFDRVERGQYLVR
jgi:hypothetical protein